MSTPQWIKDASTEKKRRVCTICGAHFLVKKTSHAGMTCSKVCFSEVKRRQRTGTKSSPETIAKSAASRAAWRAANPDADNARQAKCAAKLKAYTQTDTFAAASKARMTARHADPEWQKVRDARSSRVMKQNWGKHREKFTKLAMERYERGLLDGTGLNVGMAEARKIEAAKWIMTKARQALESETDFIALWKETQARIRADHPFTGPAASEDYYLYLKWLGVAVTSDPKFREFVDAFMANAIRRFSAEWRARKAVA